MEIKNKKMNIKDVKILSEMSNEGVKVIKWYVNDGEIIKEGQILVLLESGEFTMELDSEFNGKINLILREGEIGITNDVLCKIQLK